MRTVAVVGASLAGLQAARALRAQGFDGRLVLVGDEPHRPYDRPPLSKDLLAGRVSLPDLALEEDDDDLGAEWLLGVSAVGLDASSRSVVLADGRRLSADGVVVATGARARSLAVGEGLSGVHTLRTVDDAVALRADLVPGARLVVVGAGFIGAEVASTALGLGCEVTVLEAMPTPLAGPLGVEMGAVVSALHRQHGVDLRCGLGMVDVLGRERVEGVRLPGGDVVPADVVLVGVGAQPNVEWLTGSGVSLGNGVECDAVGRTSVPGVVAVGDCAAWHDPRTGRAHRVEHWTGAHDRPAIAVGALLGGADQPAVAAPPYFWSDQYGVRIQFAGHAGGADSVTVELGSVEDRDVLAVYRRGDEPVAVLGMNQSRQFGGWRRRLAAVPVPA